MKKLSVMIIACAVFALLSCTTQPAKTDGPLQPEPAEAQAITDDTAANTVVGDPKSPAVPNEEIVAEFENVKITKQTFQTTKTELEIVVNELNRVTFSRDYSSWLTYLSPEYRANFSDPDVLAEVSSNLPIKGVQLRSIKDYFNYVFVPSRQNMRVDDIKFVSPTRVYVIMEISPGNPAAIYIIEKFGNNWKLVPKNQ